MKNKLVKYLHIFLLFIISVAIVSAVYFKITFPLSTFEANFLTL